MKRILLSLLLIAVVLSLCACNGSPQAPENPSLENSSLGFCFSYPAGWKVVQNDVIIQIVKDDASSVNLTAFELTLSQDQSAEDYLKDYKERLSADLKNLKMETEGVVREGNGARWISYVYTATHTQDQSYRFMQSFAQKEGRLAVLTLCAPAAEFAEYNKLFESTLTSFAFTESTTAAPMGSEGRVTNAAVEYSLLCPQGWQLIRNDGMIALRTQDGSTLNTAAFTVDQTVHSLDGYMNDRYFKDFAATVGEYKLIGEYEALTVDGRYSALSCEYTATLNGIPYHFEHLLVSRAGYIYSFLYTATESNFALHREQAKEILQSVSFTKG